MAKLKLKTLDRVIFAQKLIPGLPQCKLFGEQGYIMKWGDDACAVVRFDNHGVEIVRKSDLEPAPANKAPVCEVLNKEFSAPEEFDYLVGSSKQSLIREKLNAQETDPALDRYIIGALQTLALAD